MIIISTPSTGDSEGSRQTVSLKVDRHKLAKCRWREVAEDSVEFGFDLEGPLTHGMLFYQTVDTSYVITQEQEKILLIAYSDAQEAAQLGWMIGNLHFSADFQKDGLVVEDDLAVRQLLEHNQILFRSSTRVFRPAQKATGHHHHHKHAKHSESCV